MSKINYIERGKEYDTYYLLVDNKIKIEIKEHKNLIKLKRGGYITARHTKLSIVIEDEIITRVKSGESPIVLAPEYNLSTAGIYKMLTRRGVSPRTARGRKKASETIQNANFNDYFFRDFKIPQWRKILDKF